MAICSSNQRDRASYGSREHTGGRGTKYSGAKRTLSTGGRANFSDNGGNESEHSSASTSASAKGLLDGEEE